MPFYIHMSMCVCKSVSVKRWAATAFSKCILCDSFVMGSNLIYLSTLEMSTFSVNRIICIRNNNNNNNKHNINNKLQAVFLDINEEASTAPRQSRQYEPRVNCKFVSIAGAAQEATFAQLWQLKWFPISARAAKLTYCRMRWGSSALVVVERMLIFACAT